MSDRANSPQRQKVSAISAVVVLVAIATIALPGCASTRAKVTTLAEGPTKVGELDLVGIELESIYSYTRSLAEIEAVIVSSARSNGIKINPRSPRAAASGDSTAVDGATTGGAGRNGITVFVREQSYARGFKTMLSLAIIADVRDPDGKPIIRAEWYHDGEESFDSLGYLAASLDEAFKKVSKAMQKAE